MIERFDTGIGNTKLIPASELEVWTAQGWKLVAILESTLTCPGHVDTNYINGNPVHTHGQPTTSTMHQCVIMLDETSSLAQAAKCRNEALASAQAAKKEAKDNLDAANVAKKSLETASDSAKHYEKLYRESLEKVNGMEQSRRKLENDLANVRKAIGDIRFKELTETTDAVPNDLGPIKSTGSKSLF